MSQQFGSERAGLVGLARHIIELWALAGGLLLLAIVLANAYSLAADILFKQPLRGDFELVTVGVAVAAFAFLPYCQITGANVTADIFTQRAGPRTVAALGLFSAIIALAISVLLLWRMSAGLISLREYSETTEVMGFVIWHAYVPIVVSLALLAVACMISVYESVRGMKSARRSAP
jgi:TRAP-type C4-dicarboxylate transport system permease small subunit